jgi:hypothetical protein
MIKNYLKTAWRNIVANKLFTSLNIAGLAIGMCVCITLFASISYELSFDRMYKNSKNIYRVNMQTSAQYNYKVWAQLPNSVGPAIAQNIPQVKVATRLIKTSPKKACTWPIQQLLICSISALPKVMPVLHLPSLNQSYYLNLQKKDYMVRSLLLAKLSM